MVETGPDAAGSGLELAVPASINCQMHEYQRDGVRFLFRQYARGVGGILADDMVCPTILLAVCELCSSREMPAHTS